MAGSADERLVVMLEARISEFEKRMAQAERRGTRTYQGLRRGSQTATQAMERDMTRASVQINQALASTTGRIGTFGRTLIGGLAAGAATAAISALTTNLRQTVRAIAGVGDEARRAGLGVEEFQQWSFVADQNRISVDSLIDGFKELNLRADEWIVTGAGPAAEAFQRLGFSAEDLRRRLEDPSELMLEIIRRMEGMDRAAQIRVADEAFGGTAGERFVELLAQGEQGLRRTLDRARDVGAVMETEMIQRATILDQKFQELTTRVQRFLQSAAVGLFAGGVETASDALTRMFGSLERARAIMGDEWFEAVIAETGELEEGVESAAEALARLSDRFDASAGRLTSDLADVASQLSDLGRVDELLAFDEVVSEIDMLIARLRAGEIGADDFETAMGEALDQTLATMRALDEIEGVDLTDAIVRVTSLKDALALARAEAQALSAAMPGTPGMTTGAGLTQAIMPQDLLGGRRASAPPSAPLEGSPAYDTGRPAGGGGGGSAEGYAAAVDQIRERTQALELEAVALIDAATSGQRYGDSVEYARQRAALMNAAMAEGRTITSELQAEIDALAAAYVAAGQSAEDAAEGLQAIEERAKRGAERVVDLFGQMAQGGDVARQAVIRLIAELLRMRAIEGLSGLAKSSGGGLLGGLVRLLGFDQGGYTGDGGTLEPKGVVHGGEYVFSKRAVQRLGVARLERMHQAAKGYAGGGPVGNAVPSHSRQAQKVDVRVYVDENGNWRAAVERISAGEIARAQPDIVSASVQATYQVSQRRRFT